MITIEEAGTMLDEIAEELPQEFFDDLNGGISLLPNVKRHPEGFNDDLYTLGEYHHETALGRYIVIYFGSFLRVYGHLPRSVFRDELRKTLFHEFTHHIESLAGERGLEIKDEEFMERYRNEKSGG